MDFSLINIDTISIIVRWPDEKVVLRNCEEVDKSAVTLNLLPQKIILAFKFSKRRLNLVNQRNFWIGVAYTRQTF